MCYINKSNKALWNSKKQNSIINNLIIIKSQSKKQNLKILKRESKKQIKENNKEGSVNNGKIKKGIGRSN